MKNFYGFLWVSVLLFQGAAFASPVSKESTRTYDVQGETIEQILQSIQQNGIEESDGTVCAAHTEWNIHWDLQYFPKSESACGLNSYKVSVDTEYQFPHLATQNISSPVGFQWQRFMEALTLHEKGHHDLGLQAASDIEGMFEHLGDFPNCKELELSANKEAQKIIRAYRKKEKIYDEETQHGKTQGAVL